MSNFHSFMVVNYVTYMDGTSAASELEADASLSAKYMAVSGNASVNYSISKTFHSKYQYALLSYNQNLLSVQLSDYASSVDEKAIASRLENLATFDSTKRTSVAEYKR